MVPRLDLASSKYDSDLRKNPVATPPIKLTTIFQAQTDDRYATQAVEMIPIRTATSFLPFLQGARFMRIRWVCTFPTFIIGQHVLP
jgi:hypothetical protein